jgi:hypothetical protein
MKVELIMNGVVKIVLIPENDLEKVALDMVGKAEVEATAINSQTQILNRVLHEGLVIQSKIKREENAQN